MFQANNSAGDKRFKKNSSNLLNHRTTNKQRMDFGNMYLSNLFRRVVEKKVTRTIAVNRKYFEQMNRHQYDLICIYILSQVICIIIVVYMILFGTNAADYTFLIAGGVIGFVASVYHTFHNFSY